MPVSGLIMDGLGLMLLGMGIVFSFLVILVFAMNLMSRLAADPLNEAKSLDVVAHIVDGRGDAAELLDDLESHTLGVPC